MRRLFRNSILLLAMLSLVFFSNNTVYAFPEKKLVKGNKWSSVVAIRSALPGFTTSFCSGILVSPNIVVTAAHCFDDLIIYYYPFFDPPILATNGPYTDKNAKETVIYAINENTYDISWLVKNYYSVYTGNGQLYYQEDGSKNFPQGQYKIKRVIIEPNDISGGYLDEDVAYVFLEKPVTNVEFFLPANQREIHEAFKIGCLGATFVGFGHTNNSFDHCKCSTGGQREIKELCGLKQEVSVLIGFENYPSSEVSFLKTETAFNEGDSGGPVFVKLKNGQIRIIGILSNIPVPEPGNLCFAKCVRMDYAIHWLNLQLEEKRFGSKPLFRDHLYPPEEIKAYFKDKK